MPTQGPMTVLNLAKPKILKAGFNLPTDTLKLVLTTSAQAITAAFAGTSADARYSDLTAELPTANGYTAGGVTVTGVTVTNSAGTTTVTANTTSLTLTGSVTFKYALLVDTSQANSPILAYTDMDTGGGSVSPLAGQVSFRWNNTDPTGTVLTLA